MASWTGSEGAGVAPAVRAYLAREGAEYELVPHVPAITSTETAETAHVPGWSFAKAVLVEEGEHCALVVLPVTEEVHLGELRRQLGGVYALATVETVARRFADCDRGSVPAFGQAYDIDVLLDESLLERDPVYAESGDRAALIEMPGETFRRLMKDARVGRYGHPV